MNIPTSVIAVLTRKDNHFIRAFRHILLSFAK